MTTPYLYIIEIKNGLLIFVCTSLDCMALDGGNMEVLQKYKTSNIIAPKSRKTFNSLPKLNPFPNKHWFLCGCSTSLLKTLWEKKKVIVISKWSFSHSVFYQSKEISAIFIKFEIVVCKLFQFGQV